MKHSFELTTSRLILVGADSAMLLAERRGRDALAAAVEATVPASWPPEHHDEGVIDWVLRSLETRVCGEPWRMFYMVLRVPRTLVGTCGFKGPPDPTGCVEVGYSVLQEFRCRGLATEAVVKMVSTAFDHGASEVAAQTYPSLKASLRVMEKCGMSMAAEEADSGIVRYSMKRR